MARPTTDLGQPEATFERDGAAARPSAPDAALLWRALRLLGLAALVALAVLLLVSAAEVFLLAFAGILIAVLLRAPSDWLSEKTGLATGWSLALVALAILAVFGAVAWLAVPPLLRQAGQFAGQLPQTIQTVENWIRELGGQQLDLTLSGLLPSAQALFGRLPGIVTTTFGALASIVVIVFVGVYLAAHPTVYVNGLAQLFPAERERQVRALLGETGHRLRRWLVGQLVSMAAVGVLVYAGLILLGVPLAFGLAVLAALFEFVPYLGPVLGAVPALLVALGQSPSLALYVALLYVAVQVAESYLITPLVQRRAVFLPPALLILVQVLLGTLFGLLGILLATPLAAVGLVAVQRLYLGQGGGTNRNQHEPPLAPSERGL